MHTQIPLVVQILALTSISTGVFLLSVPIGCIVLGLLLGVVGWALEAR